MEVARFEKVSLARFIEDCHNCGYWFEDTKIRRAYDNLNPPRRKTLYSAGHDISTPFDVALMPGETAMIPTGLRCWMQNGYVMMIFPRSSLGIKKKMFISNTVPIIDADYYDADNEGHILISIKNNGEDVLHIDANDSFAQALFMPYGVAINSGTTAKRTGGIGSTDSAA